MADGPAVESESALDVTPSENGDAASVWPVVLRLGDEAQLSANARVTIRVRAAETGQSEEPGDLEFRFVGRALGVVDLPAGDYTMGGEVDGEPWFADPEHLEVSETERSQVTLVPPGLWRMSGRVVGQGGAPVEGAVILLSYEGGLQPGVDAPTISGPDGHFTLSAFVPVGAEIDVSGGGHEPRRFVIRPEWRSREFTLSVWESEFTSGRVCNASGSAIPNAKLTFLQEDVGSSVKVVIHSDSGGGFRTNALHAGTWVVKVEWEGETRALGLVDAGTQRLLLRLKSR